MPSPLLSAAELKAHPGYQNLEWDLPPTKKGMCSVAKGRGGPFNLWYEVHGAAEGGIKLVVSSSLCPVRSWSFGAASLGLEFWVLETAR